MASNCLSWISASGRYRGTGRGRTRLPSARRPPRGRRCTPACRWWRTPLKVGGRRHGIRLGHPVERFVPFHKTPNALAHGSLRGEARRPVKTLDVGVGRGNVAWLDREEVLLRFPAQYLLQ